MTTYRYETYRYETYEFTSNETGEKKSIKSTSLAEACQELGVSLAEWQVEIKQV